MTEDLIFPDSMYNLTLPIEPIKLQAIVDVENTGDLPEDMDLEEAFRYWLIARALGLIKDNKDEDAKKDEK